MISLSRLEKYRRCPCHEDALLAGDLEKLTPLSSAPSSAFTYFISQNWETFGDDPHPDNARNTKLEWLKNLRSHMQLPDSVADVWIWWDVISIPQRNRREQVAAIKSLCYYTTLCSRFIPLVRDEDEWRRLYGEAIGHPKFPTAGTLRTYSGRGWCRLEVVAALAPKKFAGGGVLVTDAWRPGPRNVRFRFHHDPSDPGVGPLVTSKLLANPALGNFTVAGDRETIRPVLVKLARRYAEYAASGSDVWDATVDVHARPSWLKQLADVDPREVEHASLLPEYLSLRLRPSLHGRWTRPSGAPSSPASSRAESPASSRAQSPTSSRAESPGALRHSPRLAAPPPPAAWAAVVVAPDDAAADCSCFGGEPLK